MSTQNNYRVLSLGRFTATVLRRLAVASENGVTGKRGERKKPRRVFQLLLASLLCAASIASADSASDTSRIKTITGAVPSGETSVEVEVKASSMRDGAKCVYQVPAENGQFSADVKLFPGQNLVEVKSSAGAEDKMLPCASKNNRTLRIELRKNGVVYNDGWSIDAYDLIVNGNRPWFDLPDNWRFDSYENHTLSVFTITSAEAGLYRICVEHVWELLNGETPPPALTTMRIFLDDVLIYTASNSDGKLCWSVGAVVLHSGETVGGYAVDGDGRRLDMTGQGEVKGFSPVYANPYQQCEITQVIGPNGSADPVFLSTGEAAQFIARGVWHQEDSYGLACGQDQDVDVIEIFTNSDASVGDIDALGVFVAKAPGHTQISCEGYEGAPIDVYVVQTGITVDADLDNDVDADDEAKMAARASPYRWSLPVATNVFRPVRLDTGVDAPGSLGLTLAGDAAFRVWATASPGPSDQPLLDLPGGSVGGGDLGITLPYTGSTTLYVEAVSNGTATLTYAFAGSGTAAGQAFSNTVQLAAWDIGIYSVELDTNGYPVVQNGVCVPKENLGWNNELLSTHVPVMDRGSPQIETALGTANNWTAFEPTENGAALTITRSGAEGYKTWDMRLIGTTNGVTTYLWSEDTNSFVKAEWTNGVQGATVPLRLTLKDADFTGSDQEVETEQDLYRNENLPGYYSNYAVSDPREEIGRPAFSERDAFVVRLDPHGTAFDNLTCRMAAEKGGIPVEVPFSQDHDGVYVSCVVVPVAEADAAADLGLEASVDAVMLKLKAGNGCQMVKIDIGTVINGTMRTIASGSASVRHAMLFSCLVSDEENGRARASQSVTKAGEAAVSRLKYGVTPLFSPDKTQINDMLKRHRVWIHSGHGDHARGISILDKSGGAYRLSEFKASDITTSGLDYDLVFMNTCESTDIKFIPVPPVTPQAVGGWLQDTNFSSHAVMDIGVALNAKNYIGWDCEIARQLSVTIPTMLMHGLDSAGAGQTRTVRDAVQAVGATLQTPPKRDYWWYWERLRYIGDDTTVFDLNKKPF